MSNFLYRGISEKMLKSNEGLIPKDTTFIKFVQYGSGVRYDTVTYGESVQNAVVVHQMDSFKFPTSGISATPFLERAKYYALNKGVRNKGYVYKINRDLLKNFYIKEYRVSEHIAPAQMPEDDEVILVSETGGSLPKEIIVEIIEIDNPMATTKYPKVDLVDIE